MIRENPIAARAGPGHKVADAVGVAAACSCRQKGRRRLAQLIEESKQGSNDGVDGASQEKSLPIPTGFRNLFLSVLVFWPSHRIYERADSSTPIHFFLPQAGL